MVVGSVAFTGSAAAHSGNISVQVTAEDETTGPGESTTYTVRVRNYGSEQTFIVGPSNIPNGWSVDEGHTDGNNHLKKTIGADSTAWFEFTVTGGSEGGYKQVDFGVWHCGITGCFLDPKGHSVGSGSAGHTVDATGPTIGASSSVDGRELTVSAEVTDYSGVDSVELVYGTGGFLGIGEKRVTMDHAGGDRYETTIELGWGESTQFHVAATDVYGNQETSASVTREVETNDKPSITNVRTEVDATDLIVKADVTDDQNVGSVDLTYGTGGLWPGGEQTLAMRNTGGDTYRTTVDLDWGESTQFHVSASDVYGKSAQSDSYTRQVETNDKPSITNIRTSADGTELTVRADVTDDQGVETVDLTYGTGGLLGIGSQTVAMYSTGGNTYEATIDDLDWGDSTQFHVKAEDLFGKTAQSDDQRASVESDNNAPNIGNVDVKYDGKTVIVTADVTDSPSGVSSVDLVYDTGWMNFGGTTVAMSKTGGDTYRGTFQLDYGENFEYRVEASDNAGNNGGTETSEATVPRGTAVFSVENSDDEEKQVELRVDGNTRKTVTVPAGEQVGRTVTVDPGEHTLQIRYTEQDNGETYTPETSVSVPQSGSTTGSFTVPERLAPKITLSCANDCSFGTYNPNGDRPTLRLNVGNAGGGDLEWYLRAPMFNTVERGDDYVIVEPAASLAGEFSETASVGVENERYEGSPTAEVELSGLGTVEPDPPSVDISSHPTTVRSGVPTSHFTASVRNAESDGTADQPDPVAPEEHTVTWYVDGEQVAQSQPDTVQSPSAFDRPTFAIDGSGTATVKVVAKDPNTGKTDSDNVTVEVGTVDGEISGYTTPEAGSSYELDRWYEVGVKVKNTGDIHHTFAVEAPERTGRESKTVRKNVTLDPGASKVVTFEQRFYGTYTQTRAFSHNLISDVETEQSSAVIDEATLELGEPSNGELFLEPNTGDGESATIDVTLVSTDGTVILDERVLTSGTDVEAKQFDVPTGDYELTVNADDYRSRTTDVTVTEGTETVARPLLAPKGVDATVVSADFAGDGPYDIGDNVASEVTVKNTGDQKWEFFVGYSVRPNGTDLEYTQEGQTGTFVELAPGETETVTVEWRVDESVGSGSYDAATAVWYGYPEDGADMIEFVGWRPDRFDVTTEARTEQITYNETTYTVSFKPDNTIAVYDAERDLVSADRAKSVLGYRAFMNYSTEVSVGDFRDSVNRSTDMEAYYWAAHLNQAAITAFKAYVNVHFGSYQDGLGEYIDIMSQATRLMKEQGGTAGIGAELHRLSNISSEAYAMYDNKQKVDQYASLVEDAYRIKKATEGAESMSEAVDIARQTDSATDAKTGIRDLAISQAMAPMTDVNAGLKVTSQQALLASHWGKSAKPLVAMMDELREKRAAGTITRSEMKLYYILQTRYWGGLALTWDRMATLQEKGEQQSTAFSVISDINQNSPEEYANLASGIRNLTGLKMEQMGAYLNRSENLYNHSVNLHSNPETSALGTGEPLVVSSPGWVEPGEKAVVHVESRGDPVINAEVHVGDTVVETNRHGNATVSLWERGSYRATVEKDGFESAKTAWIVREPQVATRSLSNVNLGEIHNDENPTGRSTFENTGETTLEIESVTADHPAVTATIESGTAAPDETLAVGVSADADELEEGAFSTNVTIEWAGTEGTTSFLVTGERVVHTGTLAVETDPASASVRIDGELRGSAPVNLELPAGEHTLTVAAEGYQPTTRTVTVTGGETTNEVVELAAENSAPTVSVSANRTTLLPGGAVGVHADASDPDGDELTYRWDTDGDGEFDDKRGADITLRPDEGQHTIRVEVSDGTADPVTDSVTVTVDDAEVPAFGVSRFDLQAEGEDSLTLAVETMKEAGTLRVRLETEDETINETFKRDAFLDENAPTYRLVLDELPAGKYTTTLLRAAPVGGGASVSGESDTVTLEGTKEDTPSLDASEPTVSNATDVADGVVRVPIENTGNAPGDVTIVVRSEGEALIGNQRTIDPGTTRTIALNLSVDTPGTHPLNVSVTGDNLSETFERELVVEGDRPEPTATLGPSPVLSGERTHYRAVWSVPEGAETRSLAGASIDFGSEAWNVSAAGPENVSVVVNGDQIEVEWVERYDGTAEIGFSTETSVGPGDKVVVRIGESTDTGPIGIPNETGRYAVNASLGYDGWTANSEVQVVDDRPLIDADIAVTPEGAAASVPGTVTYEVTASNASKGVGAFNATLNVGSGAEVADATILGDPGISETEIAGDNRSVQLSAVGLGVDANNTTLARVTVRSVDPGTASVSVAVDALGTKPGNAYALDTRNATLTGVDIDPIGPYTNAPTDTDGDGVFEDINGDGTANIVDVQAFFDNKDDDAISAHEERFDFNDNGERDFLDIQALFDELGEGA